MKVQSVTVSNMIVTASVKGRDVWGSYNSCGTWRGWRWFYTDTGTLIKSKPVHETLSRWGTDLLCKLAETPLEKVAREGS